MSHFRKAIRSFKAGTLKDSSGTKVTDRAHAIRHACEMTKKDESRGKSPKVRKTK